MTERLDELALPVIKRARDDIKIGRLWKARDRLTGSLRNYPANQELLTLLGEVYFKMGDLPEAARYWYLTERAPSDMEPALEALASRYGPGPEGLARALRVRAELDEFPPVVTERLKTIQRAVPWTTRSWGRKERITAERLRSTWKQKLGEAATVAAVLIFLVGVWLAGVVAILRWIF